MKRLLWLGFVLLVYVICTGCGDTFRPIIIPNPPTFPSPKASHSVLAINDNAPPANQAEVAVGSAMVINVSGDTDVSVVNVGLAPVHAVQQTANQVLVVNHSVPGSNNDSITRLNFIGTIITTVTTISLPANSAPNFVAAAPLDTNVYVTLPKYVPDPILNPGVVVPSVAVVNTISSSVVATIPLSNNPGANPMAIAVTPDRSKLYVANQGDNTIGDFNTVDRSPRPLDLNGFSSFSAPLWLIARSDNQRVYALNGNNGNAFVSTIDTTATAGDKVIGISGNGVVPPSATYMLYDGNLNRLYIPGGNQLTILDVSQSTPQGLAGGPIAIAPLSPSSRGTIDPCASTTAQTALTVTTVAALPDGSRAYVGAYYEDSNNNICQQVTVIDAASNTVKSSIAVPGFPDATIPGSQYNVPVCATTRFRFTMAAGGDSSRVYLASCDGGMVNIIDTSDDTYVQNLPAPVGARPPIPPNPQNPPQNVVFLIAGP